MRNVLKCTAFQSAGFKTREVLERMNIASANNQIELLKIYEEELSLKSTLWDAKIREIDQLQEIYGFDSGIKELFYSLASHGDFNSVAEDRIEKVKEILEKEGYEYVIQ